MSKKNSPRIAALSYVIMVVQADDTEEYMVGQYGRSEARKIMAQVDLIVDELTDEMNKLMKPDKE